jgi:hypothetical protein
MGGDLEVVKRSGRDESVQVVIHMCMETMLGTSLYSYLCLVLAEMLSFLSSLVFSFQQNWRGGQNKFCLVHGGGRQREGVRNGGVEMVQTVFAHLNKLINN